MTVNQACLEIKAARLELGKPNQFADIKILQTIKEKVVMNSVFGAAVARELGYRHDLPALLGEIDLHIGALTESLIPLARSQQRYLV